MRNATLIALLLLAGIVPASAGGTSQEKVTVQPELAQPAIDAQNNASRAINKLRLRALVARPAVPPPGQGPAANVPAIP